MIVSHTHRFIFFAVPRTGTHSTREVLRPHLSADDWEQQFLTGQHLSPISEIANLGHGHITVKEIQRHIEHETFNAYYKFAVVRNPFDRFVSVCAFLNRDNPEFHEQPLTWMKAALNRPRFLSRILVRPQIRQLLDDNDKIAMDYVGRYESLDESTEKIFTDIGLPAQHLGQHNASEHADYQQYYDDELRRMVGELYAGDLKAFGYEY